MSDADVSMLEEVNDLPSVAVVIPCWNAEKWLARAIESVLDQNYPNLTVIVVDDGSADKSLDIIKSFGDQIRWQTGENRGACAARNIGLNMSNSDFVLFVDADDYVEGNLIAGLAHRAASENLDFVLGQSLIESSDGRRSKPMRCPPGLTTIEIARRWASGKTIQTGALLWRTAFLRGIGGWDEAVRQGQEIELVLRTLAEGARTGVSLSAGAAIWCDHVYQHRISRQRTDLVWMSRAAYLERLALVYASVDAEVTRHLSERLYEMARTAFHLGAHEAGELCLSRARASGLRGHPGTTLHFIVCSLIGLRAKESLAERLRSWSSVRLGK